MPRVRKLKLGKCINCTKEFSFPNNTKKKTCSKECQKIVMTKFFDEKFSSQRVNLTCDYCSKPITKSLTKIKNRTFNFCSRLCKDKAWRRSSHLKEFKREGDTKNYRTIVSDKFELGCTECGILDKYLLFVHHIDGHRSNNLENNLEILCANCHIKKHLAYDYSNELVYRPSVLSTKNIIDQVFQGLGKSDNPPVLETGDPRSVTETPDHI